LVTIAEAVDESLRKTTARNASPFVAERERRCLTAKERLVNASYGPNDRTCARSPAPQLIGTPRKRTISAREVTDGQEH